MAEKKYKGRRAYLNDFKKNDEGNYEYRGTMYRFVGEKETFRKEMFWLWLLFGGMMVTLLITGCLDAPGLMNSFFVILPFSVSFVFGISTGWGLWRLTNGGTLLRAYVYEASAEKLPFRSGGVLVCTFAAIVGEIMYILRNGLGEGILKILLFLLLEGLISAFTLLFIQRFRQISWEKQMGN